MTLRAGQVTRVLLAGAGAWGVMLAEAWRWRGGLVHLSIPLAGPEGLPVPLLSWLALAGYALAYARVVPLPARQHRVRLLRLGVALHWLVLLSQFLWSLAHQPPDGLSIWYVRYCYALVGGVLSSGAVALWWHAGRWRADPWLFAAPVVLGYALLAGVTAVAAPAVFILAVGAWAVAAALCRVHAASDGWASLRRWLSDERVFLALVFLAALGLRLFYLSRVMSNPDFLQTGSDGATYDVVAWDLAHGRTNAEWGRLPLFAPGYVRFVALVYWLVGRSYVAVCAAQSVIGALACWVLYDVAKRLFGVTVARLSAAFGAVNFLMVFSAAAIGHQALDIWWTLLVMWCLVCYSEHPQRWGRWLWAVGALFGWAAATREGNIVFWLAVLVWLLAGMRARVGWRTALWHAAALSAGFLVVLWPFVSGAGHGILVRIARQWFYYPNGGINVHEWFNPWWNPSDPASWALLWDHPLMVIGRLGAALWANFCAIFLRQDFGSFDLVFLVRNTPYYYGMWGYAYLFAFAGFGWVVWRVVRHPVQQLGWMLLLGVLVSRSLVHLFLEASYRHRPPLEPYLIMLAGYGFVRLLGLDRSRA